MEIVNSVSLEQISRLSSKKLLVGLLDCAMTVGIFPTLVEQK